MYSDVWGPYQRPIGDVVVMYSDAIGPYQWFNGDVLVMYSDVIGPYQWLNGYVIVMYSDAIGPYQGPISFCISEFVRSHLLLKTFVLKTILALFHIHTA